MRRRHCNSFHEDPSVFVLRTLDIRLAALQYGQSEVRSATGCDKVGTALYMVEDPPINILAIDLEHEGNLRLTFWKRADTGLLSPI